MKHGMTLKLVVFSAFFLLATTARALTYGTWSGPVTIQSGQAMGDNPDSAIDLTLDSQNQLHAIWATTTGVYYSRLVTGIWTMPELLATGAYVNVRISANRSGKLAAMWSDGNSYNGFLRLSNDGTHLGSFTRIFTAGMGSGGYCSGVDISEGGTVFSVCGDYTYCSLDYWTGSAWSTVAGKSFQRFSNTYPIGWGRLDVGIGL